MFLPLLDLPACRHACRNLGGGFGSISMRAPTTLNGVRALSIFMQSWTLKRSFRISHHRGCARSRRIGDCFLCGFLNPCELSSADALGTIRFWACIPDHISLAINAGDEHGIAVLWATRFVHYVARTTTSHRSRVAQRFAVAPSAPFVPATKVFD